jgi:hypothetical protein
MSFRRVLAPFLLVAVVALAADPRTGPELRTLDGKSLPGKLVKITGKEIVVSSNGQEISTPLEQVLHVDFRPAGKISGTRWLDVELIDGSLLHCLTFAPKGATAELTLVTGQTVKVPLNVITWVANEANDPKVQAWWKEELDKKRTSDLLAVRNKDTGKLEALKGTFGDGNDDGTSIQFDLDSAGTPRPVKLEKLSGMSFLRTPPVNPPPTMCKLTDVQGNLLMVSAVTVTPAGFSISTPAGAKIDYPEELLARLDYSKDKLMYLSDMELKVEQTIPLGDDIKADDFIGFSKDTDPGKKPVKLKVLVDGKEAQSTFTKWLDCHADTVIPLDLKGEYREFRAMVGVPGDAASSLPVTLKIEADGKEVLSLSRTRTDAAKDVYLLVKDVKRLRILVTSDSLLKDGQRLVLGDAKVSK